MITDFYLEPVSGEFDVSAVEAFIEAMPFTARDEKEPTSFLVARDEETLEEAVAQRRADDQHFPMPVHLIGVHPERVDVSFRLSPLASVRTFVKWARDHYSVRVRDEDYNDVTAQLDPHLDLIFGPEP